MRKSQKTWDENYNALKEYAKKYGTTRLTGNVKYKGFSLGSFVAKNRYLYNKGELSQERINKLKNINFVFDPYGEDWNFAYELAIDYYNEYGNLLVLQKSEYKGFKLGGWISNQRAAYNKETRKITRDRILKLEAIGMIWDANVASWEKSYLYAKDYYECYGNLDIKSTYEVEGFKLGKWISNQRTSMKDSSNSHILTPERINRLNEIGMLWEAPKAYQTSFPEQALYFYFKKVFPDALNNDRSLGFEVDVLDMDSRIGMEYDGWRYHQEIERDLIKNQKAKGVIELYRFREKGCPLLEDGLSNNIDVDILDDYNYLSEVFQNCFDLLCSKLSLPSISVDIYRDIDDILLQYNNKKDVFDFWFNEAEQYYNEYGNLLVKSSDKKHTGLYNFIGRARSAYYSRRGHLTKDEVKKLESIGMIWNVPDYIFAIKTQLAKEYYYIHGDINIPTNTIIDGINMGNFISVLRRNYSEGRLDRDSIQMFESMGVSWKPKDKLWQERYDLLKKIYNRDGNIDIQSTYVEDDIPIGKWLYNQIKAYWGINGWYLSEDKISLLEDLNIDWKEDKYCDGLQEYRNKCWMSNYYLLKEYVEVFDVESLNTRTEYEGIKIGAWLSRQRSDKTLSNEKIQLLKAIGIKIKIFDEEWMEMYELVKEFVDKYGWDKIVQKTKYKGKNIGKWLDTRRLEKRGKSGIPGVTLTEERIKLLDDIGMVWEINASKWNSFYDALKDFLEIHSWDEIHNTTVYKDYKIGDWVMRQRRIYNGTSSTGELTDLQIKKLEELGIVWNVNKNRWDEMFLLVKEYVEKFGWDKMKYDTNYKNKNIGAWLARQKGARRNKCGRLKISQDRIDLLDSIGIDWN